MRSLLLIAITFFSLSNVTSATQILSKSKLEKCQKVSDDSDKLNCTSKIVLNLSVPSDSDVAYKPQEFYVRIRKCEPDAGAGIVKMCERLRNESGYIIENTQPTCCSCGDRRRVPSSCGNFIGNVIHGKANTAHCLRFTYDRRLIGFSVRIEVKTKSKTSEVIVSPENRTAISSDNFLRVNLVGDYTGYTNIPPFDDFYHVIPRLDGSLGQPQTLGSNFSMWMLLERVRFTLDGFECNKIGVGYEAFNVQPDFCAAPFWSCLHNHLWNFWDADQNRINRNQVPLYCVQGRFERINQHPVMFYGLTGIRMQRVMLFSIGITEVLNTNLLVELSADDIEYVYQRSPGKIIGITVPTFEALTQFEIATIMTKYIGEVEASYSLTLRFYFGFYIKKDSLILYMTGVRIVYGFLRRELDMYGRTNMKIGIIIVVITFTKMML